MSDKELLELAAKAAGYDKTRTCIDEYFWVLTDGDDWHPWNPLTDDGDALRLAVKLGLLVDATKGMFTGVRYSSENGYDVWLYEKHNDDPYAATRRAIVRAAAEIGRGME